MPASRLSCNPCLPCICPAIHACLSFALQSEPAFHLPCNPCLPVVCPAIYACLSFALQATPACCACPAIHACLPPQNDCLPESMLIYFSKAGLRNCCMMYGGDIAGLNIRRGCGAYYVSCSPSLSLAAKTQRALPTRGRRKAAWQIKYVMWGDRRGSYRLG